MENKVSKVQLVQAETLVSKVQLVQVEILVSKEVQEVQE
jgi:hypothetical protein